MYLQQYPLNRCHFLDLPFYETGKIEKNPISEADVNIVEVLLRTVKPHQIYVAGDLADPMVRTEFVPMRSLLQLMKKRMQTQNG